MVSAGSRLLCQRIKAIDPIWLPRYVGAVAELALRGRHYAGLFGRKVVLVPVPRCIPSVSEQDWPAWQLARALSTLGLAGALWVALERRSRVRKSATSLAGERPSTRQHYDSLAVCCAGHAHGERIVLVDDVITQGRTLFAAAARLREAVPEADVRAFALVRTLGFLTELSRVLDPCQGVVRWAGGDARREP